jgi:hypothetical protein
MPAIFAITLISSTIKKQAAIFEPFSFSTSAARRPVN